MQFCRERTAISKTPGAMWPSMFMRISSRRGATLQLPTARAGQRIEDMIEDQGEVHHILAVKMSVKVRKCANVECVGLSKQA